MSLKNVYWVEEGKDHKCVTFQSKTQRGIGTVILDYIPLFLPEQLTVQSIQNLLQDNLKTEKGKDHFSPNKVHCAIPLGGSYRGTDHSCRGRYFELYLLYR